MTESDAKKVSAADEEQRVAEFLKQHGDFLARNPELLVGLEIPHAAGGGSVSLIERQVQVLRQTLARERRHLEDLVATARENERVAERLHRIATEVAGFLDLDAALAGLQQMIREMFDISQVALRVEHPELCGSRREVVHPHDPAFIEVRARVTHGRSISDDRLPVAVREYLFGDEGEQVASCALVPVGGRQPIGVIALGSERADRFSADQGTLYLDRLGDLAGAALQRLLNH